MIYDEERNCYTLTKLEENCIKLNIENENLQKKLDIAVKALEELEIKSDKFYLGGYGWSLAEQLDFIKAKCQETLYYLKEIKEEQ